MARVSHLSTSASRLVRTWYVLFGLMLGVAVALAPTLVAAQERTPADDLTELRANATLAIAALQSGDVASAQAAYGAFDEGWDGIEDGIRAMNRDMYRAIEGVMDEVKSALLRPADPNPDEAMAALQRLDSQIDVALPSLR